MSEEFTFGYELKSKQVRRYKLNDISSVRRAICANAQEYLSFEGINEESPVNIWRTLLHVFISSMGVLIFLNRKKITQDWPLYILSYAGFFGVVAGMLVNNAMQQSHSVFFMGSGKLENNAIKKFAGLNRHKLRFHLFVYPYSPQVKFLAEIIESRRLFENPKSLVSVEKTVQYGKYFGSTGFFYPPALVKDIDEIIESLIQKISQHLK
ncbi:unnamed protein product [Phytomonas sp. EM1]|nr:unnamed protein product [Phytomonas sp. EM1]|eukprot:CCW64205.1 unnamed protein product [Phytomonas sp. isolate EM1]